MNLKKNFFYLFILLFAASACRDEGENPTLVLSSVKVGSYNLDLDNFANNQGAPQEGIIVASFSLPLDIATAEQNIELVSGVLRTVVPATISFSENNTIISIAPVERMAA